MALTPQNAGAYVPANAGTQTPAFKPTFQNWTIGHKKPFTDLKQPFTDVNGDLQHFLQSVKFARASETVSAELLNSSDYLEALKKKLEAEALKSMENEVLTRAITSTPFTINGATDISETSLLAGFVAMGDCQIIMAQDKIDLSTPLQAGSDLRLFVLGEKYGTARTANQQNVHFTEAINTENQILFVKPGAIAIRKEVIFKENGFSDSSDTFDIAGLTKYTCEIKYMAIIDFDHVRKSNIA